MFDNLLDATDNVALLCDHEKCILQEPEQPMTIIAAMWESDDSILIGADSGETEDGTGFRSINENKLQFHPRLPLAWGACGNPAVGIDGFAEWLRRQDAYRTWNSFRDACQDKIASLSKRQVSLRNTIGLPHNLLLNDCADVLIVRCLENSLRILEVNRYANATFISHRFHAIGAHPASLAVAYESLSKTCMPTAEHFHNILDAGARRFPKCDPPIHIRRVTCKGIEVVRPGEKVSRRKSRGK